MRRARSNLVSGRNLRPGRARPFDQLLDNGEAPVEIKQAAAQGAVVTSLGRLLAPLQHLDNRKDPTTGCYVNYKQEFAGLGGQSDFIRETFDARWYHPITEDFIGQIHLQAGQINSFGNNQPLIINNFMQGPVAGARLRAFRHRPARHLESV